MVQGTEEFLLVAHHRFQDVAGGKDLISLQGVFPAGGEKYDFHALIQLPYFLSHVGAFHLGHVDVKKDEIKITGTEIRKKRRPVHVGRDVDFHIGRITAAFEIGLEVLLSNVYVRRIVVNQSNVYHGIPSFSLSDDCFGFIIPYKKRRGTGK